jgi:hypothetical protein
MLKYKLLLFLFQIKLSLCNCHTEIRQSGFVKGKRYSKTTQIGQMPSLVNEGSGLVKSLHKNTLLTHNDGGGKPELYEVDSTGNLLATIQAPTAQNIDWEELTQDSKGNLYIGDVGNNQNQRNDLVIYKVLPNKGEAPIIELIKINYQHQKPKQSEPTIYDCEAMVWHQDSLFLFSKNRGNDHFVRLYALPAHADNYALVPKDSIYLKTQVTGAAIRPDGKELALLTYGKVFLFDITNGSLRFTKPAKCIKFAHRQTEAITYWDNANLLITNEQRQIFRLQLKN